jgi:hypothetical protein
MKRADLHTNYSNLQMMARALRGARQLMKDKEPRKQDSRY